MQPTSVPVTRLGAAMTIVRGRGSMTWTQLRAIGCVVLLGALGTALFGGDGRGPADAATGKKGGPRFKDRKRAEEHHHAWPRRGAPSESLRSLGSGPEFLGTVRPAGAVPAAQLACHASAIVVGSVATADATVASTGDFVFTDYGFRVEEALKPQHAPFLAGDITVTRVGGEAGTGAHKRRFRSRLLPPLDVGKRYLLFLTPVQEADSFAADVPGGTLLLTESGEAEQVDGVSFVRELPQPNTRMAYRDVLSTVRSAIGVGCPR
jgi:hypothetical protein